jgi:hypothetical protein
MIPSLKYRLQDSHVRFPIIDSDFPTTIELLVPAHGWCTGEPASLSPQHATPELTAFFSVASRTSSPRIRQSASHPPFSL